jgi:hypothetical protein
VNDNFLHRLTGKHRTRSANRPLGAVPTGTSSSSTAWCRASSLSAGLVARSLSSTSGFPATLPIALLLVLIHDLRRA